MFFTKFSPYYFGIERLVILSAALMVIAFLSFGMIDSTALKMVLFIIYSLLLFNIKSIAYRVFGEFKISASELFPEARKRLYKERLRGRSWQSACMIVIVWFFMLKLWVVLGGARYLAEFSSVQEMAARIPSGIFLKDGMRRDGDEILLFKIFKIVDVVSVPFVSIATCMLTMPFFKNPKVFPISPMAIYLDDDLTTFQLIRKILWASLAFFVLLFGIISFNGFAIFNGYTTQVPGSTTNFKHSLDMRAWYLTCGMSIVDGILMAALLKMIIDGFCLIGNILPWKERK